VALVCDWFPPRMGGLELHLHDLARALAARGHAAEVICTVPGPAEWQGVRVHRLEGRQTGPVGTMRRRVESVGRVLRAGTFDVVHCHSAISPLAQTGTYVARTLGLPSVLTEHSVLRPVGTVALRAADRLWGWGRWPDVLSAVSDYVQADLRGATGRDDVVVLRPGLDPAAWPVRPELPAQPLVTSALRFTRRKRPQVIVAAAPRILAGLPPALRPRFLIMGDGRERARLTAQVERLGLTGAVDLPGFVSHEDVAAALVRSSVFVLPSDKEACPVSVLQARCAGIPVVSFDNGGIHEVLGDGTQGFVVDSVAAFAERVIQLLRDPGLQEQMGRRARDGIERFSWDRVVAEHVDVYRRARAARADRHGR
jgi:glycosyltransferase involved in cell wall biosynthesis